MPKAESKPRIGRPASPFNLRTPVRHTEDMLSTWRIAAARAGVPLQDWIRATLNLEAAHSHHCKPLTGKTRRG